MLLDYLLKAGRGRSTILASRALFMTSALGFVALLYFPIGVGFFSQYLYLAQQHQIGAGAFHYNTRLTGLEKLDDVLNGFTGFFYNLSERTSMDISLLLVPFLGSAVGVCVLGMVESGRLGNQGKLPSFFTTMSMLGQLLGLGFVCPAYLGMCLGSSGEITGHYLTVDHHRLSTIPLSIVLGFGVPSMLAALPAPSLISVDLKVQFVRIWEVFPVVIYIAHALLQSLARQSIRSKIRSRNPSPGVYSWVYAFGITCSGLSHICVCSLLLTVHFFPSIFQPHAAVALHPAHIIMLVNPFSTGVSLPPLPVAELWFIQWDFALISTAHLIWALGLCLPYLARNRGRAYTGYLLVKAFAFALLLGPISSAILLIWERDTEAFGRELGETIQNGAVRLPDSKLDNCASREDGDHGCLVHKCL
ncbi:hypothetical protein BDV23DRAFT_188218 [Aspergillus alliaceus]|uniref:Uncharacterized protein n=1 Tax=Petromyces alliaceus TaxID=209559 RepID=A0A5N7BV57_PETAA|nr:hypothetical protein BDV23DRAFT_188218 [Aspergillus alliaceus]